MKRINGCVRQKRCVTIEMLLLKILWEAHRWRYSRDSFPAPKNNNNKKERERDIYNHRSERYKKITQVRTRERKSNHGQIEPPFFVCCSFPFFFFFEVLTTPRVPPPSSLPMAAHIIKQLRP